MVVSPSKGPVPECTSLKVGNRPAPQAQRLLAPRFSVGLTKPTFQLESRRDGAHCQSGNNGSSSNRRDHHQSTAVLSPLPSEECSAQQAPRAQPLH